MSTKRVVHVVGTGTLGEPLISLLLNLQRDLEFDELTFHKNRPLLDDRVKILTLMRRGAKLAVEADKVADFEKLGLSPTYTRPEALAQATVVTEDGQTDRSQLRSVWVIVRDYEQEIAFILALWSITLIVDQARAVSRNRKLLDKVYVEVDENHVVLPEDARAYARPLERLPFEEQDMFLPRALMMGLNRFGATKSVQDAAESVIDAG